VAADKNKTAVNTREKTFNFTGIKCRFRVGAQHNFIPIISSPAGEGGRLGVRPDAPFFAAGRPKNGGEKGGRKRKFLFAAEGIKN
jgi:hypothetical protein